MKSTEYSRNYILSYNTYARRRTIGNVTADRLRTGAALRATLDRGVKLGTLTDVKVVDEAGADVTGEFFQVSRVEFSHQYQRPNGWIRRTVYAEQDRIMVRFDGEAPYVLHHMWTADRAVEAVEKIRQREVNISHDWACNINRRFDTDCAASLIAASRRPPRGDVLVARRQEAA